MAYIRHISPAQAAGRLAHVYQEIRAEIPRVPRLMQAFSLRPETMEGVYRAWLSCMWNGSLARRTKELIAMVVSRAVRCDYCSDAHMVFLLAAGMGAEEAFDIETRLDDSRWLTPPLRTAVRFALKLTNDPRNIGAEDRAELKLAWPSVQERVELLSVASSFNCIARIANALGVTSDIPAPLRRFAAGRKGAVALLARLTSMSVDLSEKSVPAATPDSNRRAVEGLFYDQLDFDAFPPGFEVLEQFPDLFDGQMRLIEKAVAVVPRDRWMRVGFVVARLLGCDYFSAGCSAWLKRRGIDVSDVVAASEGGDSSLSDPERSCLRFARDLTLYSHTIDEGRVDDLRRIGMSDGAVLDLAFVAGILNGIMRFVQALGADQNSTSQADRAQRGPLAMES